MYKECLHCDYRRMCINGIYCDLLGKYVQYSLKKECKTNKTVL